MGSVKFTKSHGLGNDFIIIDNRDGRLSLTPEMVRAACDRHFGIGADGLILIKMSEVADYFMDYRNADGSYAQMCGNGIRALAKYLYDHIDKSQDLKIDTPAGVIQVRIEVDALGGVATVKVDMGEPILESGRVPVQSASDRFLDVPLTVNGREYRVYAISMGNPHCVVFVDNVDRASVATDGPAIERLEIFPEKTNVEFVQVVDQGYLRVRVWERGVGETLACGTGACAALVVAVLAGKAERGAIVELPGGHLTVKWNGDNRVSLAGRARQVYTGQMETANWPVQGEKD